ncbi:MAG TPA: 3'-5' exonuclease [Bacteroidales bacterium]|jgi:ribonuclease D|nr:3'-5' exonuclease [Bacteroidales bacterium]
MENKRYPATITPEEIEKYELSWFRGEIVLVDDFPGFYDVLPRLLKSEILGFDTETKPSFRKGRKNNVSLIQLATEDLACLIRINKIGIPSELAAILADPGIIKAGVAVHDDIKYLRKVKGFSPSGFIDLQKLVREYGIENSGLKKLTAIILGFRISKRQQVTDWEAEELSEAQMIYAATDAWVCQKIYKTLINGNIRPIPEFQQR